MFCSFDIRITTNYILNIKFELKISQDLSTCLILLVCKMFHTFSTYYTTITIITNLLLDIRLSIFIQH